jgi:hypothetical protein
MARKKTGMEISESDREVERRRKDYDATPPLTRTEAGAIKVIAYGMGYAWRNAERTQDGGWEGGRNLLHQTEEWEPFLAALKADRPEIGAALQRVHDSSDEGGDFMEAYRALCDLLHQEVE